MNFQDIFRRHHRLLLGSAALSLLLAGGNVQAAEVCNGTPFPIGAPDGSVLIGGVCLVTQAALDGSTQTVQRLIAGAPVSQLTIESDATIINTLGPAGNTVLSGATGGGEITTLTNAGVLRSISTDASTIAANPSIIFRLINTGTVDSQNAGSAVFVGQGVPGLGPALSNGDVLINNSGSIIHSQTDSSRPFAIVIASNSGDVTINNMGGAINAPAPIIAQTNSAFYLTNEGEGTISGTGDNQATVFVGNGNALFVPTAMNIVNGVGSTISATGENGSAIAVGPLASNSNPRNITNHGTISSTGLNGFAVFLPLNPAGGGVTVENDGTIEGDILLGNSDDLVIMSGGRISGSILAQTDQGFIDVSADSRINGAVASSSGASFGDRSSVDLSLNFGTLTFTQDAALTVGHSPTNAALNNNVFFSQLSTDIRAAQDGKGTINYLFGTDINQSVGTSSAALKAANFLSGVSVLNNLDNAYFVRDTTIGSGARLELPGHRLIAGNMTVNGILDLNDNRLAVKSGAAGAVGDFTTVAGSTIITQIFADGPTSGTPGADNNGYVTADGKVTLASGTQVLPEVQSGVSVSDGARYNLALGGGASHTGQASVGELIVAPSSAMTWGVFRADSALFSDISGNASDVFLVANPGAAAGEALSNIDTGGSSGANAGLISTFAEFASPTGQAEGQTLFAELLSIPSSEAIATALTQLSPDTSGGASQGASAAQGASSSAVGGRTDVVQAALSGAETGVAAGDTANQPIGIWGQFYGFNALQDRRRGNEGYSALGGGMVMGVDTRVSEDTVVGAAFSYGQTRIDGRGTLSNNRTDVDSYQASLYGVLQGAPWYLQSEVGFAFQEFDAVRAVTVGAISERPTADFGGLVFSAGLSGGYPIDLGKVTVTPSASLDYVYSEQAGYTETNAPITALAVNSNRDESLRSGLTTSVSTSFDLDEGGKLVPEVHLGWFHEFQATESNSVSSFAFGSTPFVSRGAKPAKDALNVGTSVDYVDNEGLSLSVQYNAEFKDRYLSNTLALRARWEF